MTSPKWTGIRNSTHQPPLSSAGWFPSDPPWPAEVEHRAGKSCSVAGGGRPIRRVGCLEEVAGEMSVKPVLSHSAKKFLIDRETVR